MRQTGTVKFFNHSRGFGFITPDDGGKDVFLHISALQESGNPALDEGARVSFETEPDRRGKGPQAVNVQIGEWHSPKFEFEMHRLRQRRVGAIAGGPMAYVRGEPWR